MSRRRAVSSRSKPEFTCVRHDTGIAHREFSEIWEQFFSLNSLISLCSQSQRGVALACGELALSPAPFTAVTTK
jgi:hypothetical protein